MNAQPGTYVLVLRSDGRDNVRIGRWGLLSLRPGWYLYVGSAFGPGGVRARVSRHCRIDKAMHWHIDYLRAFCELEDVCYSHARERLEHRWAASFAGMSAMQAVDGFGCSDCDCEAHLFFSARRPGLASLCKRLGRGVQSGSCGQFA